MIIVVNYIIYSITSEQAYSGTRNSGFSDYACPQVRRTAATSLAQRNICLVSGIYLI